MIVAEPPAPFLASLWHATATPLPASHRLVGDTSADVVIVGGGYAGLSTAIHLAERGTDVVVLEAADEIGLGASGLSGGQVNPGIKYDPDEIEAVYGPERAPALVAFAGGTPAATFDLIARLQIDCDAIPGGFVQPAVDTRSLAMLERRCAQWERLGAPVEVLNADGMTRLLGSDAYVGGWIDRRGGTLHPLKYVRGLAGAAVERGVRLFTRSRATRIERKNQRWRVSTGAASVTCDALALLTNAYSDGLWPGLARSFVPVRSFQVATTPLPDAVADTVLPAGHGASDTRRLLLYWRRDPQNRLMIGGRSSFRTPRSARSFAPLEGMLRHLYPQASDVAIAHRWYGYVAMTLDSMPRFNRLGSRGLALVGCNGRGVALYSALGEYIAEWLDTGRDEVLPLPLQERIATIPFHRFHTAGVGAVATYYRVRDWTG